MGSVTSHNCGEEVIIVWVMVMEKHRQSSEAADGENKELSPGVSQEERDTGDKQGPAHP